MKINKSALDFYKEVINDNALKSKESKFKAAAEKFVSVYQLNNDEIDKLRRRFSKLLDDKPTNISSPVFKARLSNRTVKVI